MLADTTLMEQLVITKNFKTTKRFEEILEYKAKKIQSKQEKSS